MKNIEIIMTGYVSNLIEHIWDVTGCDCINIHRKNGALFNAFLELYNLYSIMSNKEKYPNVYYIELVITQEEENKYITLLDLGMSKEDLFTAIYEENKHKPSTEY